MVLANLGRSNRQRSHQLTAPIYPEVRDYDPRYDDRLSLDERKQAALDCGLWIDPLLALKLKISREEQAAAFVANASRSAAAADWKIYPGTGTSAYERFALHTHLQGWAVFPETNGTDGERKPAAVPPRTVLKQNRRGQVAAWSKSYKPEELRRWAVKTSQRRDENIKPADLAAEIECVDRSDNLAIVIGPASGHVRVLDIDVVDEDLSQAIQALAAKILGVTPFIRIGRAPKAQLIYRVTDDDMLAFPSRSWALLGADGEPDIDDEGKPRNAIEWLGYGRHFTCYGLHHKTRASFDWSQGTLHPAISGPENAPVVSSKQFKQFLSELYKLRKFVAKGGSASNPFGNGNAESTDFVRSSDDRVWIPKTSNGDWIVDEQGIVVDGREDYVAHLAWAFAAANAELIMSDDGAAAVLEAFIQKATETCMDGKVKGKPAALECRAKWPAPRKKWRQSMQSHQRNGSYIEGRVPYRIDPASGRRPCAQHIKPSQRPADGSLDWLPAATSIIPELADRSKINGVIAVSKSVAQIKSDKEIRALVEDEAIRALNHAKASAEVKGALQKFLGEVAAYEADGGSDVALPVHILMAPTGGGKTTMSIGELVIWLKTNPRRPGQGPVLISVPTHANAEEALKVADRNGLTVPDDVEVDERKLAEDLAALRGAGLVAEVFKGKEKAGCRRMEELNALISKGINASKLCGTDVDDEDEIVAKAKRRRGEKVSKKEVLCPVREAGECGYWQQHDRCAQADVVFVPHAYLTTPKVPKVLAMPRLIIIDESIVFRLLHTVLMPLEALETGRPEPWLTKKEKDAGFKADELHHMREVACVEALKALAAGKDVAGHLFAMEIGKALIDAAILVCKRAHVGERDIRPDLTFQEIQEIANRPKGQHLAVEERFWKLVNDRFNRLAEDARMATDRIAGKRSANGDRDARIKVVYVPGEDGQPQAAVRLSWRSLPNWHDAPMMLLDASASPRIMGKVFARPIVEHKVTAPMHVRTVAMIDSAFSNASFIPRPDATEKEIAVCAWNVERARRLILKVAAVYSYGPVIVGMTKAVRETIFTPDWIAPPNIQPMHFGALRGLDYAKNAVAALSIGRSEMPIHIVDGYVAALTYDDPCPEQPYDLLGTGLTADGKPLLRQGVERRIKLRTGEDWDHYVPSMPIAMAPKSGIGPSKPLWAGEIEGQWREEELRQFLGRLRPVYRAGEAPVWICMSKCLPADTIVDDIVTLDDAISDWLAWGVFAEAGGVFADGITDKLKRVTDLIGEVQISAWVGEQLGDDAAQIDKISQGMAKIRYQLEPDGPVKVGRVAGWWKDPEALFREIAAQAGVEPIIVDVEMPKRDIVELAAHKADKLTVALDEARADRKAQRLAERDRMFVERVHALLPPEEGLSLEDLKAMHGRGEDLEALLIGWLHSWRDDRDVASVDDTARQWQMLKAMGPAAVDEAFGIAGCMAAE